MWISMSESEKYESGGTLNSYKNWDSFDDGGQAGVPEAYTNQQLWDFTQKYGNYIVSVNGELITDKNKSRKASNDVFEFWGIEV